jgi:hypothetical protein
MTVTTQAPSKDALITTDTQFVATKPLSVSINSRGSFVRSIAMTTSSDDRLPRFGGYDAGTIKSRVLQLLHEIGHLTVVSSSPIIRFASPAGKTKVYNQKSYNLLLPVDGGGDAGLSKTNTTTVINACKTQIDAIP